MTTKETLLNVEAALICIAKVRDYGEGQPNFESLWNELNEFRQKLLSSYESNLLQNNLPLKDSLLAENIATKLRDQNIVAAIHVMEKLEIFEHLIQQALDNLVIGRHCQLSVSRRLVRDGISFVPDTVKINLDYSPELDIAARLRSLDSKDVSDLVAEMAKGRIVRASIFIPYSKVEIHLENPAAGPEVCRRLLSIALNANKNFVFDEGVELI